MNDRKSVRNALIHSAVAAALMAVGTQYVQAQANDLQRLQVVVVTAQKVRQNINDVGMSITALSGDQLRQAGITSPGQLAKDVAGLNYNLSTYGTPIYTLRGVGFYDTVAGASPAVSVYLDQVPLPYPDMARGVTLDVRRVEVLKGPQGTLFGQNATGGAINFVPNPPTRSFRTGGDLTVNNYGETTADGYVSGPLSEKATVRFAASTDHGGAWQKSDTRDASNGATRRDVGRMLLDFQPTDALKLEFNLNGWIDKSDEQAGQIVGLVSARPLPALVSSFDSYPVPPSNARQADWQSGVAAGQCDTIHGVCHNGFTHDDHFVQTAVRADYALSNDTTLTSITAWERLDDNDFVDTDGMQIANYNVSTGSTINTFSQELRLEGRVDRLQWLFGGNFENDRVFNWGDIFAPIATFPFPKAGSIGWMNVKTYAAFAHGEYALAHNVSLVAGVRYTDVRIGNSGCTLDGGDGILARVVTHIAAAHGVNTTIAPGSCTTLSTTTFEPGMVNGKLDQSNVPFTAGINWKVTRESLLYASVGRGYKAGDFSPVGAVYSSSLDPATQESVLAYEVGFKARVANDHLQLSGATFYYDYRNKQVRGKIVDPVVGPLNKLINIPKSRIDGGEFDATWLSGDHWIASLGASYTDSTILDNYTNYTYGGAYKDMEGEVLPLTPKLQWLADVEYDFRLAGAVGGFAGAHANHQDSSYSGLGEEPLFRNDSYTDLDLRIGARADDDRWSAMLFVNNATNEYSWNFVGLGGPDAAVRYANLPRIFGIRLTVRN